MNIYFNNLKLIPFYQNFIFLIRKRIIIHNYNLKKDFLSAGFKYLIIFVAQSKTIKNEKSNSYRIYYVNFN